MWYYVYNASTYRPKLNIHESTFWTLGEAVRIVSSYPFNRGDLVNIVSLIENSIRITPVKLSMEEIKPEDKRLLMLLSNPVPVAAVSDYEFTSETSEILLTRACEFGGNKKYIIAAGLRLDVDNRIIGVDRLTGTRFEFQARVEQGIEHGV